MVTQREAGLGAAQGQSLTRPAQSPGSHPKHHKKREKKKSVTINVRAALGEPLTAGKVDREPSQSSHHLKMNSQPSALHFLCSIGCYNLYK